MNQKKFKWARANETRKKECGNSTENDFVRVGEFSLDFFSLLGRMKESSLDRNRVDNSKM